MKSITNSVICALKRVSLEERGTSGVKGEHLLWTGKSKRVAARQMHPTAGGSEIGTTKGSFETGNQIDGIDTH